ncbi:MAG TPA: hypothetical protein PLX69_10820 [Leptospiraceae bacterium]|nr:hypothetical protein [Leptospiraceae bacterium]HRG75040.1 hypothetical protein [Leptospiraceae bacterium]
MNRTSHYSKGCTIVDMIDLFLKKITEQWVRYAQLKSVDVG